MLTSRGWWLLATSLALTTLGIIWSLGVVAWLGLALLLWFGCEWLFFLIRLERLRTTLQLERTFFDERGLVKTLWAGRCFRVQVRLTLPRGRIPFVVATDPLAFSVLHRDGDSRVDGPLAVDQPLQWSYRFECPQAGVARFEGVRLELSDYQGMFASWFFHRQPVELPILPAVVVPRGGRPLVKQQNAVPPPGVHRLAKPGSGGELLDLRDYQPGDPPRTIAWKVSARREKLITREFESEVPVRTVLFVDTSSSVLFPSPAADNPELAFRPLDRLIALAASLFRILATRRDLSGLCLFDEQQWRVVRPARGRAHLNSLMRLLGEAAASGPKARRADPEALLPLASALAEEIYPERLQDRVNKMPFWLMWWIGSPVHPRHGHGLLDWLNRHKRTLLFWASTVVPLGVLALNLLVALSDSVPRWTRTILGTLTLVGLPLLVTLAWLVFLFTITFSGHRRKLFRWRKKLAALLAQLHGLPAGSLEYLLQDDDAFSEQLQRFLAFHRVPYTLPLTDERGCSLIADSRKISLLSRAVLETTSRGQDNELYVLLVDLLEYEEQLAPLLSAIKVARARHHQVMLVQPWPRGVPLPNQPLKPPSTSLMDQLRQQYVQQVHSAFHRLRRTFARLGVVLVCAEADDTERLILERLERLRRVGGRR
ncbi:MAG: DUF58 domain-containing protein [Gemmataceae bacterium]